MHVVLIPINDRKLCCDHLGRVLLSPKLVDKNDLVSCRRVYDKHKRLWVAKQTQERQQNAFEPQAARKHQDAIRIHQLQEHFVLEGHKRAA